MKLKLKIPIPENASVYAENGDRAHNLLLYDVEQLEVLEEVRIDTKSIKFQVRDGQFVNKGDIIFTEGFLGHKAMVADFNGIIEIKSDRCRILGQKRHFERKIHFNGNVIRVVPEKFIELLCEAEPVSPVYYTSFQNLLTELVYFPSKEGLAPDFFRFAGSEVTFFINDTLYIDDLAKIIAFGARRVIVNSMFITDLMALKREVNKLEGFAIISGFGELVAPKFTLKSPEHNVFWSKHTILFSDEIEQVKHQVFEHPFWGIAGNYKKKNELVGSLDHNQEIFEFYLKNIEHS